MDCHDECLIFVISRWLLSGLQLSEENNTATCKVLSIKDIYHIQENMRDDVAAIINKDDSSGVPTVIREPMRKKADRFLSFFENSLRFDQ
jgi:hypothetical protein